ncbi:hypothetical protein MTBBW1_1040025 [Desulfamplus magnetovallimortis]|uniref:Uncharacterized protein n=1 Tax=Desulfamplus magnetovallimortis TaxID=1246637 RepID=A0A1W1H5C1_9BACT|nr:hypothetical protein MTBBW1_1040025 [Desulfamplus magnetovallimortis]
MKICIHFHGKYFTPLLNRTYKNISLFKMVIIAIAVNYNQGFL